MENLERIVAEHPFTAGLRQEQIELLAGCAANVRFDPGMYVCRENEEANHFYLIRKGRVALQICAPQRKPIIVDTLAEGDILGWSWLVPPHTWRFQGQAMETTLALSLDGKCLRGKCEANHELGYELFKRVAILVGERLDATRMQLLDIYSVA